MAGRGETVKYIIDADTSDFVRGMAGAATAADLAGRRINRSLTGTSKRTENNFNDIRRNAATAASSIRNFGVAFQAFNTTAAIIGITALSGAVLELGGALAAAGSTVAIFAPLLAQGLAATGAFKAGVSGLGDSLSAIAKNDGEAFLESLANLGPAATSVAFAFASLNQALNSIKLNTQQALLEGIGDTLLQLGANVLPTVNQGFQIIGQALNRTFKEAAQLTGSPMFSGLLSAIFSDTARTIDTLTGALAPFITMFTYLYAITAPYVQLLSEWIVKISEAGAAYMSSAKGQTAFNTSIMYGVVALQQIGSLIGSVFGFLTSIFRTSIESGASVITTITGIINKMTEWINSAEGQSKLTALFQFTTMVIESFANALGTAINVFLGLISAFTALNPQIQSFVVGMLASGLIIRPLLTYVGQLYLAFRVLAVTAFNVIEQTIIVARTLGMFASVAVIAAGALIFLSQIIGGPLGSAMLIIGVAIGAFVGLSYLLTMASNWAASAMVRQGYSAMYAAQTQSVLAGMNGIVAATMLSVAGAAGAAGTGLTFAARAAMFLQAALLPLLVLAAGVLTILGMLGVFSGKAKEAGTSSIGLGSSLSGLNKSLKGVGSSGGNAATGGLSALNTGLQDIGSSAEEAQKGLSGFDKMNVLADKTAGAGAGMGGIGGVPTMPLPEFGGLGGGGMALPPFDTGDFDKQLADMMGQFEDIESQFDTGFSNPFKGIGEFISANPLPFFIAFAVVLGVIIALFATGAVTIGLATLPLTLIVIAIIAIIAIIVLLVQNWGTVWATITSIVGGFGEFMSSLFQGIFNFIGEILTAIGTFFSDMFNNLVNFLKDWGITILAVMFLPFSLLLGLVLTFKDEIVAFFQAIVDFVISVFTPVADFFADVFRAAWSAIKTAFAPAVAWFKGIWTGVMGVFASVGSFFGDRFRGAWNAVKSAFSAVGGFFQGIWNNIVSIFGKVGTAIGNAIGGAFKGVVNTVLNTVSNIMNTVIDLINGAISLINKIPGVRIGSIGRLSLPRLAKGGVVSGSTFAEIGEDGAEAVMPLERNTEWIDKLADRINLSNNNSNGQPVHITVQIGEDKIATQIIELINEKTQMSGRNSILV